MATVGSLIKCVLSGTVIFGSLFARAEDYEMKVRDISDLGIPPQLVTDAFQGIHGICLKQDSSVKVSPNEEGNSIKFETLDHLSIIVPHHTARGSFNKVTRTTSSGAGQNDGK